MLTIVGEYFSLINEIAGANEDAQGATSGKNVSKAFVPLKYCSSVTGLTYDVLFEALTWHSPPTGFLVHAMHSWYNVNWYYAVGAPTRSLWRVLVQYCGPSERLVSRLDPLVLVQTRVEGMYGLAPHWMWIVRAAYLDEVSRLRAAADRMLLLMMKRYPGAARGV